ncbi:MAG: hypothetical protein QXS81_05305, partial [Candidatus Micrarchaeaceae archaeon]
TVNRSVNKVMNITNATSYVAEGLSVRQNISLLSYNVTAIAQTDQYGYGPVYLLEGVTDNNSYEIGLSYNSSLAPNGYYPGFRFVYEVILKNGSNIYGAISNFSGPVDANDKILLNLNIYNGKVFMRATDWNTGTTATANYSSGAATNFDSYQVATLWYFGKPVSMNQLPVTFSPFTKVTGLGSLFIIGELSQVNFQNGSYPIPLNGNNQYYFTSHNISIYYNSSDDELITGAAKYANAPGIYNISKGNIPPANVEEQIGLTFAQNTSSLSYNITAVAQSDRYGYGPAYLLSGLSNTGYLYSFGLKYNLSYVNRGYPPGFYVFYNVHAPNGTSIFPKGGGSGGLIFNGAVNPGDKIIFNMSFGSGNVIMKAKDWNTGATASISYNAEGASYFVGNRTSNSNLGGYFSGLETLWFTTNSFIGNEEPVVYQPNGAMPHSAWLWINSGGYPVPLPINNRSNYIFAYDNLTGFFNRSNGTFISGAVPKTLSRSAVNISNFSVFGIGAGFVFNKNTTSVAYNVTVVAQSDSYGYGPSYDISGLTERGYLYLIEMGYNESVYDDGYVPGFTAFFEEFKPNGNFILKPLNISGIKSGDRVLMALNLSKSNVTAEVRDWNTGQSTQLTYQANGTQFIGLPQLNETHNVNFTGARIIWYNPISPYYAFKNETFQPYITSLSSESGTLFIHGFYMNSSREIKNLFFNETLVNGTKYSYSITIHNISVVFNQANDEILISSAHSGEKIATFPSTSSIQPLDLVLMAAMVALVALIVFAIMRKNGKKVNRKSKKR